MELDLYTAGIPQTSLSHWITEISIAARAEHLQLIQSTIEETVETLQEELSVVLDDLCSTPDQRVSFCGTDAASLQTFVYKGYRSRLSQSWNVCLYFPSKHAIFLPFDEGLLAKRVTHLYYREGASDKVYDLYLAQALTLDFYSVISRYGRRGGSLKQTERSFDYRLEDAEKEWDRLHHAKIQKGYKVGRPSFPKQLELELPF